MSTQLEKLIHKIRDAVSIQPNSSQISHQILTETEKKEWCEKMVSQTAAIVIDQNDLLLLDEYSQINMYVITIENWINHDEFCQYIHAVFAHIQKAEMWLGVCLCDREFGLKEFDVIMSLLEEFAFPQSTIISGVQFVELNRPQLQLILLSGKK